MNYIRQCGENPVRKSNEKNAKKRNLSNNPEKTNGEICQRNWFEENCENDIYILISSLASCLTLKVLIRTVTKPLLMSVEHHNDERMTNRQFQIDILTSFDIVVIVVAVEV